MSSVVSGFYLHASGLKFIVQLYGADDNKTMTYLCAYEH